MDNNQAQIPAVSKAKRLSMDEMFADGMISKPEQQLLNLWKQLTVWNVANQFFQGELPSPIKFPLLAHNYLFEGISRMKEAPIKRRVSFLALPLSDRIYDRFWISMLSDAVEELVSFFGSELVPQQVISKYANSSNGSKLDLYLEVCTIIMHHEDVQEMEKLLLRALPGKKENGQFKAPPAVIWPSNSFLYCKLLTVLLARMLWNTFSLLPINSKDNYCLVKLARLTDGCWERFNSLSADDYYLRLSQIYTIESTILLETTINSSKVRKEHSESSDVQQQTVNTPPQNLHKQVLFYKCSAEGAPAWPSGSRARSKEEWGSLRERWATMDISNLKGLSSVLKITSAAFGLPTDSKSSEDLVLQLCKYYPQKGSKPSLVVPERQNSITCYCMELPNESRKSVEPQSKDNRTNTKQNAGNIKKSHAELVDGIQDLSNPIRLSENLEDSLKLVEKKIEKDRCYVDNTFYSPRYYGIVRAPISEGYPIGGKSHSWWLVYYHNKKPNSKAYAYEYISSAKESGFWDERESAQYDRYIRKGFHLFFYHPEDGAMISKWRNFVLFDMVPCIWESPTAEDAIPQVVILNEEMIELLDKIAEEDESSDSQNSSISDGKQEIVDKTLAKGSTSRTSELQVCQESRPSSKEKCSSPKSSQKVHSPTSTQEISLSANTSSLSPTQDIPSPSSTQRTPSPPPTQRTPSPSPTQRAPSSTKKLPTSSHKKPSLILKSTPSTQSQNSASPSPTQETQSPTPPHTRSPTPPHTRSPTPPHTRSPTPPHTRSPTPPHTRSPTSPHTRSPTPPHTRSPIPPHTRSPTPPHTQSPTLASRPSSSPRSKHSLTKRKVTPKQAPEETRGRSRWRDDRNQSHFSPRDSSPDLRDNRDDNKSERNKRRDSSKDEIADVESDSELYSRYMDDIANIQVYPPSVAVQRRSGSGKLSKQAQTIIDLTQSKWFTKSGAEEYRKDMAELVGDAWQAHVSYLKNGANYSKGQSQWIHRGVLLDPSLRELFCKHFYENWNQVKADPEVFDRLSACLSYHILALTEREQKLRATSKYGKCPSKRLNWWRDMHGTLGSLGQWWRAEREHALSEYIKEKYRPPFFENSDEEDDDVLPPLVSKKEELEFRIAVRHFKEHKYPTVPGRQRNSIAMNYMSALCERTMNAWMERMAEQIATIESSDDRRQARKDANKEAEQLQERLSAYWFKHVPLAIRKEKLKKTIAEKALKQEQTAAVKRILGSSSPSNFTNSCKHHSNIEELLLTFQTKHLKLPSRYSAIYHQTHTTY